MAHEPWCRWCRGAGSSLEGHVNALNGGVSIDLSRMNRVLRVSVDDLDVTVEAGVTHRQLNKALANTGVYFWVDPGADATIGGMVATGASGTTTVRYGTMRETVRGLTVVLADGRIIKAGGRARKSSAGYDLTRLFVGSEGTLGVITEVTLRVHGLPEAISAAVCPFESMEGAVRTDHHDPAGVPLRVSSCWTSHDRTPSIATPHASSGPTFSSVPRTSEAGSRARRRRTELPRARRGRGSVGDDGRGASEAGKRATTRCMPRAVRAAGHSSPTSVCRSKLAEITFSNQLRPSPASQAFCRSSVVGDSSFHLNFVFDPDDPRQFAEVKSLNAGLIHRALACGGTSTGEHGIGMGKIDYLVEEHGEALDVMKAIKRALDPDNRMNPGKLFRL
jgi:D-lactate dehydrogenase (cytochrome)